MIFYKKKSYFTMYIEDNWDVCALNVTKVWSCTFSTDFSKVKNIIENKQMLHSLPTIKIWTAKLVVQYI